MTHTTHRQREARQGLEVWDARAEDVAAPCAATSGASPSPSDSWGLKLVKAVTYVCNTNLHCTLARLVMELTKEKYNLSGHVTKCMCGY